MSFHWLAVIPARLAAITCVMPRDVRSSFIFCRSRVCITSESRGSHGHPADELNDADHAFLATLYTHDYSEQELDALFCAEMERRDAEKGTDPTLPPAAAAVAPAPVVDAVRISHKTYRRL